MCNHKRHSKYGSTGPNKNVEKTCFRGDESWLRAGSILDAALPQLPVSYTGGGMLTSASECVGDTAGDTEAAF